MTKLTAAEQEFYEWLHVNGLENVSIETQRYVFMAGWYAAAEFIGSAVDEEPAS